MTEKDLKKLSRQELLEVLLAQSKKIDRLQAQLKDVREQLADKELKISQAGSIAEASLVLNNIFADAQKAADQYLENIRLMHERAVAQSEEPRDDTADADLVDKIPSPPVEEVSDEDSGVPELTEADATVVEDNSEESEAAEVTGEENGKAVPEEDGSDAEVQRDRLAAAAERVQAEADRKAAAEYLEEVRRIRQETESECAEMKRRTDKQIRISLLRTKKAVKNMMTLYADEVTRRMKRMQEWDRQMEALHERTIEKQSSRSQ